MLPGPILRLEMDGCRLTKAQRYGQPTDRPIHRSGLATDTIRVLVESYLEFAMQVGGGREGRCDGRGLLATGTVRVLVKRVSGDSRTMCGGGEGGRV